MPIKNLCFQEKQKNTFSIIAPTPVPICETVCCAKVGDCFQWKQSSKCVKWEWKHLVFLSWICSSFKTKLNFCCTQAKYRHVLLEHDLINIAAIFRPLVTKRVDQSSKRLKLFYSACVFLQRLHTSRFDCSVLCLGIASGLNICGRSCDRREEPNLRAHPGSVIHSKWHLTQEKNKNYHSSSIKVSSPRCGEGAECAAQTVNVTSDL